MESLKKIGIVLFIIAIAVVSFGFWLKNYNDRIAQNQISETGTCFLADGTCLHTTSDSILFATIIIAIVIAFAGFYLFNKKPQKVIVKRTVEKRIIEAPAKNEGKIVKAPKTLSPEYRKVFDIIAESDGAILQGELVKKSDMDKVKISRILDKLEMQGLIERRRHGMSNMVVLKKN